MYLLEDDLQIRIRQISNEVSMRSNGLICLEETIAIPYYGQIILRFTLKTDEITFHDLDSYENMLYEIVGDEFLVDFMGSVYQRAGVGFLNVEERLEKLAAELPDEISDSSLHRVGLQKDAEYLLKMAGLETSKRVWEIQMSEDEWLLLIMGRQNRKIKTIGDAPILHVAEVPEKPCIGLMKAAFIAKNRKVSLARLLAEG